MNEPICGACGEALNQHIRSHASGELRTYCNWITTGDVFTDEPQDSVILKMLLERMPDTYDALVADWKRENGHAVTIEETP